MELNVKQLPCDEATFLAKLAAYRAAREAHKITIGVPAPFPEYEIFRVIVDRGAEVIITHDALIEQSVTANRDALAELDVLKSQVRSLTEQMSKIP